MAVFVINLPRSRGRRRTIRRNLAQAGVFNVEIVRAVDGSLLPADEVERATASGRFKCPSPAMVGCSLSHLRLHRRLVASTAPAAVILEDDCVPAPSFGHAVADIAASVVGRTAVLLHAKSIRGAVELQPRPVYEFTGFALFEPVEPHNLTSSLAYVATTQASSGLAQLDAPICEPDRWGVFLELGLLDRVLVAHPFLASDALYSSTIGYAGGRIPQHVKNYVDALPGVRSLARRRRAAYTTRVSRVAFADE